MVTYHSVMSHTRATRFRRGVWSRTGPWPEPEPGSWGSGPAEGATLSRRYTRGAAPWPRAHGKPEGPHRLAAQDVALSRRRHGFESRWGHELHRVPWCSLVEHAALS